MGVLTNGKLKANIPEEKSETVVRNLATEVRWKKSQPERFTEQKVISRLTIKRKRLWLLNFMFALIVAMLFRRWWTQRFLWFVVVFQ